MSQPPEDPRRRLLLQALSLGWLAGGSGWAFAGALGERPTRLPAGRSVFAVQGEVLADGKPVNRESLITPTQTIQTGPGAHLVFVLGSDALLLRENSRLELRLLAGAKQLFRLVNGALLSVFGPRDPNAPIDVHTTQVYMGIRGTGLYVEARAQETYACTCYGRVQLTSALDAGLSETVTSLHHDAPRLISAKGIAPAPFINHTDAELMLLEALVGREVPFGLVEDLYSGPRRDY